MGRHKRQLTPTEQDFQQSLRAEGYASQTLANHEGIVHRFLKHVGKTPLDRISEEMTRAFFAGYKGHHQRQCAAVAVSKYLRFATARLPAVINARGAESPRALTKKEIALRQKWTLDRLIEQKEKDDDLIAKLARRVIDHYLFFQGLLKTDDVDLDTVARFADECRELIENNLALFMGLSAEGRNIHSAIDERVQR